MKEAASFLEYLVKSILLLNNPSLFNAAWLDVVIIEIFHGYIEIYIFSQMQLSRKCDRVILKQET